MNTSKKSLLIGLLFGGALLFGIMQSISANASQPNKPHSSPTPEVLENGWYRFTDEEAGYSFSYPPNSLSIFVGKDKGDKYKHLSIQFSEVHGHGYQGMIVRVIPNPKKLSVEDFLLTDFTGISDATSEKKISTKKSVTRRVGRVFYDRRPTSG